MKKQRIRCSRVAALLTAAVITSGCDRPSDTQARGQWMYEQDQKGDTVVMRTLSGSVWGDTMQLVPDLAIGELEGAPPEVFGRIASLDVDVDGRIIVLDAHAIEVRVFSEAGEHLVSFGRAGGGPGEFRSPDFLRARPDGSVVVRDQAAARFSVFSRDGEYVGSWPRATGYGTDGPFFIDGRGGVVNPSLADRLLVYDLDRSVPDTVPVPTLGYQPSRLDVVTSGGRASYGIPFTPSEHWTMTRDGRVVIGVSNSYSVDVWDSAGRVLRVERRSEPVAVAEGEANQARDRITQMIRSANDPDWRWRGPDIPRTKPEFRGLQPGLDGTIWIFREGPSYEEPNPYWDPERPMMGAETRWTAPVYADVFDPEGRYLGPVEIPESVNLFHPRPVLSQEFVWAAAIHEDGFPQVVRFRIQPN